MITMLECQQNGRRIGRHVPEAPDVRWGSKTGGLKGVTNDVGFVTGPGGRLILAVFCEGMGCGGETPRAGGVEGCVGTGCRNNRAPQPSGQGDPTSSGDGGASHDSRSQPASSAQPPSDDGQESGDDRDQWNRTLGSVPGGADTSEGWNGERSEETRQ